MKLTYKVKEANNQYDSIVNMYGLYTTITIKSGLQLSNNMVFNKSEFGKVHYEFVRVEGR